ncbi:hypothetical protein OROGR_031717 [Orobanche gracilis]
MQETLHTHDSKNISSQSSFDALESATQGSDEKKEMKGKKTIPKKSLFRNWPLMSSIIVYCVFSLHDMAYTESPRRLGGLSYSTGDVGTVLAISVLWPSNFSVFVISTSGENHGSYPTFSSFRSKNLKIEIISIPLLTSYHFIALLSGITLSFVLNCASLLKNVLSISIVTGLFILQNRAVDQHQRGAANGISMTLVSLFKAVGPAGGGILFSWGQKRQHANFLPGDLMVFFILNVIEAIGVLLTFKPFLVDN